ncbi:hypothetical protein ACOI1H_25235 [Loktanella sp. DJP18]|uniref:hypothetical protein n=1 Tax=Loktanella sp. DJP18 TaxID=3409788 RepID=UPI003BB5B7DE
MTEYSVFHTRPTDDQLQSVNDGHRSSDFADALTKAMLSGQVDDALDHDLYSIVAIISADSIDAVFRDSNHIDSDWTENDSVRAVDTPVRSTSVGDIIQVIKTGCAWACAPQGWIEIKSVDNLTYLKNQTRLFQERHKR